MASLPKDKSFSQVLIVPSRQEWPMANVVYDPKIDLVLSFDYALRRDIEAVGGYFCYLDLLLDQEEMQKNNFLAFEFFKNWHKDVNMKDIFISKGISFGFAFRIEMWSEFLYHVRLCANLIMLKRISYQRIVVSRSATRIHHALSSMLLQYTQENSIDSDQSGISYFFDIHKYMNDALHKKTRWQKFKSWCFEYFSKVSIRIDYLIRKPKIRVFAQSYHPTISLIEKLRKEKNYYTITANYSPVKGLKKYFVQRFIPLTGKPEHYSKEAIQLMDDFRMRRVARMCLSDGSDITPRIYDIIEERIEPTIARALFYLNSVKTFVDKWPIHFEIMIANLGLFQTVTDCVLKYYNVPQFMVINGLLYGSFFDEAKYATFINAYSSSIKKNYFQDADNVYCLGDPRMDKYYGQSRSNKINRNNPTIVIGSSGFNNIDLNSYTAVEFDFISDILETFRELRLDKYDFNIVIKVRPNAMLSQYQFFVSEYFAEEPIEIVRDIPIASVLNRADLYISINSQTIFEAACLGIPVIYYKKDREVQDPPFDLNSELVSACTVQELRQRFLDFLDDSPVYLGFLDKNILEKYIGYLDGNNTDRNMDFIKQQIEWQCQRSLI